MASRVTLTRPEYPDAAQSSILQRTCEPLQHRTRTHVEASAGNRSCIALPTGSPSGSQGRRVNEAAERGTQVLEMIADPARSPGRARHVLVVDDDQMLLRAFERTFRRDYDVRCASSGGEALQALSGHEVDVLVTDFSMPVMNGIDLLQAVVARHPAVARLMLTAYADIPEVVALKKQGLVNAVLMKPWNRDEVAAAISQALQLAAMRRAVADLRGRVSPPGHEED